MLSNIHIKLTRVGSNSGPFNIYDEFGNLIAENISREQLISGIGLLINSDVEFIKLVSTGDCPYEVVRRITFLSEMDDTTHAEKIFYSTPTENTLTGCVWRHLTNPGIYNSYYGVTKPYIIEYPFAYEYFDQIVQNIKDFTRVYKYITGYDATFSTAKSIETDDDWFNKLIVYNGQQCSGILELVPKPKHNLYNYMSYPRYNSNSKTVIFAKSDSWYQVNTMWDVLKDKVQQMFVPSCESMSVDKEINQENMDYGKRSFNKAPIRGKDTRVRYILDDKSDVHLVSRLTILPSQISYK